MLQMHNIFGANELLLMVCIKLLRMWNLIKGCDFFAAYLVIDYKIDWSKPVISNQHSNFQCHIDSGWENKDDIVNLRNHSHWFLWF